MSRRRDNQLTLEILSMVPRIARATARSVPPADFGPAIVDRGIANVAAREQVSRSTAFRLLKRAGTNALKTAPAEPARRPCPAEFDTAYIEHGYDECEVIFRASPQTVKRWLEERGAERLRKARADFVAARRAERKAATIKAAPKPKKRAPSIDPELASAAANFLRGRPHRLVVFRKSDDGAEWYVDTKGRVSDAEMVAIATARGFLPPANLTLKQAAE